MRSLDDSINGLWRCTVAPLPDGRCTISQGAEVRVIITPFSGSGKLQYLERIPAQIYHATQTTGEVHYRGRMSSPPRPFPELGLENEFPTAGRQRPARPPKPRAERIYEAHIGISSGVAGQLGTFDSFRQSVLPRIIKAGYTTVQLMGVAEHPYYPSFGYQVTNFFAVSSRFGSVTDLIALIDDAHSKGIRVVMDIVHAHASTNEGEGLNRFDGTENAGYFKGHLHPEWTTRLFDYEQMETLRFLLCNLRYWITRVGFDGFRFDAVTAMIYRDHGLNRSFTGRYDEYFGSHIDDHAITYLMLANHLLDLLAPGQLTTIAEDVSGYPSLCIPVSEGGIGFTYRLALGIPDCWFDLLRRESDMDAQSLGFIAKILGSLMLRRANLGEPSIAFVESHDQCIVGGSTAAQWLFAGDIYSCMSRFQEATPRVEMAMAWHKLMRMLTHTLGGEGYMNFMGNEFGHPEASWIDLPSDNNHYSQDRAYRKWNLVDDTTLRFEQLHGFDQALNDREEQYHWLSALPGDVLLHEEAKRHLVYVRADLLFIYNLDGEKSWTGPVPAPKAGRWANALDTDEGWYGGKGQTSREVLAIVTTRTGAKATINNCFIPPRTGAIFRHVS
ncbi:hypothetical protein TREMEDRAFT_40356 [Tremella mesenterica DSM 1558]|uniref:uncharacterized protein n=1 Tax=Tremella mesenterica (strain ATCC 24925 / CBS 8224 / DSM 1558 / NBRC 9311 / NRRL Y-6157 / RJB 2259-6 / UBC 559-6) TaxID=578456 RepID=UPI0003F4958E|nr:uncharacterized protein TREMEDRAFT_40356 [Tremella mesenterica DSM 1558]EIW67720.1 hypothetical protein TREMEDRAFT_40356 [Tremella mesenterica DSM 1558]